MKVIAFGEILWDIIEGEGHLGGAPFNFTAHFAQYGGKSSMISAVGIDKYGDEAIRLAQNYGVDVSFIQRDNLHDTGTVEVTLTNGQPDYEIKENVAYDFIVYNQVKVNMVGKEFDVFYFGSLSQRSEVSSSTLKKILANHAFKYIFYDVNLRKNGYTLDIVVQSLGLCNVLKLNIDEAYLLAEKLFHETILSPGQFCERVATQYSIKIVIVTAAERGCFVYHQGKLNYIPGKVIVMADAVGAGDAFSASFMYEFLKHGDVSTAATKANEIGAFVASQKGPIPRYPSEILGYLEVD